MGKWNKGRWAGSTQEVLRVVDVFTEAGRDEARRVVGVLMGSMRKRDARLAQRLGYLRNRLPGRKPLLVLPEVARHLEEESSRLGEVEDWASAQAVFNMAQDLRNLTARLELCRKELRR